MEQRVVRRTRRQMAIQSRLKRKTDKQMTANRILADSSCWYETMGLNLEGKSPGAANAEAKPQGASMLAIGLVGKEQGGLKPGWRNVFGAVPSG
jgi:hypothetical protein